MVSLTVFVAVLKTDYPCIMGSCNNLSLLRQKNMVGKNFNVGTPEAENKEENIKRLNVFGNTVIFLKSW